MKDERSLGFFRLKHERSPGFSAWLRPATHGVSGSSSRPGASPYLFIAVAAGALALGIGRALAPPGSPPAYSAPKPHIGKGRPVTHRESILIDEPLERYMGWSANVQLDSILPGSDGIPRVLRTESINGMWGQVSGRRRVVLEDGHFAAEEILENDGQSRSRYQVWGYTNPARLIIRYAIGEFNHAEEVRKTRVTRTLLLPSDDRDRAAPADVVRRPPLG